MSCTRWLDDGNRDHCDDCRRMAADADRIASLTDPAVSADAWPRLQRRLRTPVWIRVAAALLIVATPLAVWRLSEPPRFDVEVIDMDEAPDASAWFAVLTQHAESDAVPMVPPAVEEE